MRAERFLRDSKHPGTGRIFWTSTTWRKVLTKVNIKVVTEQSVSARTALDEAQKSAEVAMNVRKDFLGMRAAVLISQLNNSMVKAILAQCNLEYSGGRISRASAKTTAAVTPQWRDDLDVEVRSGNARRSVIWGPKTLKAIAEAIIAVKDRHIVGDHVMRITTAAVLLDKAQEMILKPCCRKKLHSEDHNSAARRKHFLGREDVVEAFKKVGLTIVNDHILRKEEKAVSPEEMEQCFTAIAKQVSDASEEEAIRMRQVKEEEPTLLEQLAFIKGELAKLAADFKALEASHKTLQEDHLALQEIVGVSAPEEPEEVIEEELSEPLKVYIHGVKPKDHLLKALNTQFHGKALVLPTKSTMEASEFENSLVVLSFSLTPRTEDRERVVRAMKSISGVTVKKCSHASIPQVIADWLMARDGS